MSALLQRYFMDLMPYLVDHFAYKNHIAASACVCLKKGFFLSLSEVYKKGGGSIDCNFPYLMTERGHLALNGSEQIK